VPGVTVLHHKHLSYVVHVVEVVVQNCGSERISSERIEWIDARVRRDGAIAQPRRTPKLVSRGPVLRLALLATVDAGTAFANGERRIFVARDVI